MTGTFPTPELSFRYRSPALDFTIVVESSLDLITWAPLTPELVASSQDGALLTVTRRLPLPADPSSPPLFRPGPCHQDAPPAMTAFETPSRH